MLHFSMGAPVMLISNLRTVWNLVNGLRGRIVGLVWEDEDKVTQQGFVSSDGPSRASAQVIEAKAQEKCCRSGWRPSDSSEVLDSGFPWLCRASDVGRTSDVRVSPRTTKPA